MLQMGSFILPIIPDLSPTLDGKHLIDRDLWLSYSLLCVIDSHCLFFGGDERELLAKQVDSGQVFSTTF